MNSEPRTREPVEHVVAEDGPGTAVNPDLVRRYTGEALKADWPDRERDGVVTGDQR